MLSYAEEYGGHGAPTTNRFPRPHLMSDPSRAPIDYLTAALAADASASANSLPSWIVALAEGQQLVAEAEPVWVQTNDNLGIRRLLEGGRTFSAAVLVVAGASESGTAVIGDLTARELLRAGIIGLVTDGPVRDAAELRRLDGFAVWCRTVTAAASHKNHAPPRSDFVVLGGVPISRGDLVVADDDGVCVWPAELAARLAEHAQEKYSADQKRLGALSTPLAQ
jgi:4-hydroxy-4-methyl-2-oxoglutarate aldolase